MIRKSRSASTLLPAIVTGVAVCMGLGGLAGVGPLDLVETIWTGAWGGTDAAMNTLSKMTPLLLTGLSVALAYSAGLLNIGCEGQLTLGALVCATVARLAPPLPGFLLLPLALLSGALVGGVFAYPAVVLRQRRGVHEVITTLILNYIAIYACSYFVSGPLGDGTAMGRTPLIPEGARMAEIVRSGSLYLTAAPPAALLMCFAARFWLSRTVWGFEARASGSNPEAATNAGIAASKWQVGMFVVSGALAGLAGAMEVCAVHHRFYRSFSPGYGFDGLTAAFLANGAPGWLWLSTVFLASLRSADKWLQIGLNVSPNFILVVQAVLLFTVTCQGGIKSCLDRVVLRFRGRGGGTARAAESDRAGAGRS
ncbi:MAG: ABC transporter permease [Desulfobacteraceae bacterium]|nr:ABC transporter permease [Desulfobacteraceae bacterium]